MLHEIAEYSTCVCVQYMYAAIQVDSTCVCVQYIHGTAMHEYSTCVQHILYMYSYPTVYRCKTIHVYNTCVLKCVYHMHVFMYSTCVRVQYICMCTVHVYSYSCIQLYMCTVICLHYVILKLSILSN